MRKTNYFKSSLMILLMCFGFANLWGQETLFSEGMGTGSGTNGTAISTWETSNRFDNVSLTFSGTGDVRSSNANTGNYTPYSGTWNILLNSGNTTPETFIIDGIDATNYTDLVLSFGVRKMTNAETGSNLTVSYSTTGASGSYTSISWGTLPTGTNTGSTWYLRSSVSNIPSNVTTIRFSGINNSSGFCIDDVKLIGTIAGPSYTLTYTAGANGSISGTSPQTVQEGQNGSAITAVADLGYHFVNWSDASTDNPRTDTNVQGDISVTANFAINTYTITYDGNGSDGGTAPVDNNNPYNHGSDVTVLGEGDLTKSGYNFVSWNTVANGSGTTYAEGNTIENITSDITLYAQWIDASLEPQTITFDALADKTYGDSSFDLTATASSGLTVSYVSSNENVATIVGKEVTIVGVGTTTITASQAGDEDYQPAEPVQQTLDINQKNLTIDAAAVTTKTYDGTTAAEITGTLSGIVGSDDVNFTGGGEFASADADTGIAVTTNLSLIGADVGNYILTQPVGLTGTINKANQTLIGFEDITKSENDADFDLPEVTNAGLTVSYDSTNEGVATIDGNTVTIVGVGITTITASAIDPNGNWEDFSGSIELEVTEGPCGLEDFSESNATASYGNGSFVGNNGITWTYVASRDENGDDNESGINGKALMLRRQSDGSKVTSSTIPTGIQDFSVKLYKGFTSNSNRQVTLYVNGELKGTSIEFNDYEEHIFSVENINIAGDVIIEIRNNTGNQVIVDDITWTCYTAPPAAITWLSTNEWSNGAGPGINDNAIIEGSLTIADNELLQAKELTIANGGSITVASGGTLKLAGKIINQNINDPETTEVNEQAAAFVVASGGNLIQTIDYTADDNEGAITVQRDSRDIVRLDYTMWSSPVKSQGLRAFSPETLWNRIYTYKTNSTTPGDHGYAPVFMNDGVDTFFVKGKGYMFRAPNNWEFPEDTEEGAPYHGEFTGVPLNGDVSAATFANGYTSIGNPYPSNIDPEVLFSDNYIDETHGIGTLYFWNNPGRHLVDDNGTPEVPEDDTYAYDDGTHYVTCSLGGFDDPEYIDKSISVGQGFIVYTTESSVNFNNGMRVSTDEAFFKTDELERNRIWLSLLNADHQKLNSILVSYMTGATNGIDHQIDGAFFGYDGSSLYNIINEEKYAIQGRALPFESSDVVPLGFKASETGKFTISLANFDGLFSEGQVIVYLKDKALNTTHNLMESDYTFESVAGEFKNRFEIVYEEEGTMNTNDLTKNNVLIYKNDKNIVVESKQDKILAVELFDLQGRNLHRNNKVNSNIYSIKSQSKGVLVVRVQTQNGEIVSKKIIN